MTPLLPWKGNAPQVVLTLVLLASAGAACTSDGRDAQAQTLRTDSVMESTLGSAAPAPSPSTGAPRLTPEEQAQQPLRISDMGYNEGSPQAPLKVLEFSDFGCGYCRRFHEDIYPKLKKIYIDTGLVEWKYTPFVMGMFPNGLQAALAGECAGEQENFSAMKDRLFAEQAGWKSTSDPEQFFTRLASEGGLDVERFTSCMEGGWREARVRANIRLGQQVGVRGTPTFLVDGKPLEGAVPFDEFQRILDVALRRKGVSPPAR